MKNKRGFLLGEETVKIIIAVIALSFLIYLLTSIYFSNVKNKEFEQSEASLDYLIEQIEKGRTEADIYNPAGKWIFSWPYEAEGEEVMPDSCSNVGWENCLCICDKKGPIAGFSSGNNIDFDWTSKECGSNWICKEAPEKVDFISNGEDKPIKIENPPLELNIEYGDIIKITERI